MFAQPTIKLIALKNDLNREGTIPIYMQFILRRKVDKFSIKLRVPLKSWTGKGPYYIKEKGHHAPPNANLTNCILRDTFRKADSVIKEARINNEYLDFKKFKHRLNGDKTNFLSIHYSVLREAEKRMPRLSLATFDVYRTACNHILKFHPNLLISEINKDWILRLKHYLKIEQQQSTNTAYKTLIHARRVCKLAKRDGHIKENPFDDVTIEKTKKKPNPLPKHHLDLLWKVWDEGLLNKPLRKVLKQFLFACETGCDYGDMCISTRKNIIQRNRGYAIAQHRKKKNNGQQGNYYFVPLSKRAMALVGCPFMEDDYDEMEDKDILLFKMISNQKTNKALNDIRKFLGIDTKLTFHRARHTFGTTRLNEGFRLATVQKMMGHSSPQTTLGYAELGDDAVSREFDEIKKR